jgi:hypothetical protein
MRRYITEYATIHTTCLHSPALCGRRAHHSMSFIHSVTFSYLFIASGNVICERRTSTQAILNREP